MKKIVIIVISCQIHKVSQQKDKTHLIKILKKLYHLCFISAERDIMIDFHNISKSLKNITAAGELVTEYYNHSDESIIAKDIFINQSELFVPNVTNINNLSIAIVPPINYPRQLLKYVQTYQFPSILWDTIFISTIIFEHQYSVIT